MGEDLRMRPLMPASSKASCAAVAAGDSFSIGQPFGITQRRVPREVTSRTCGFPLRSSRIGIAPYWRVADLRLVFGIGISGCVVDNPSGTGELLFGEVGPQPTPSEPRAPVLQQRVLQRMGTAETIPRAGSRRQD